MKVLVTAAHCDDETLGCGGTIARHSLVGDQVSVLILVGRTNRYLISRGYRYSQRSINRVKGAAKKAGKILGIKEILFADLEDEELGTNLTASVEAVERTVREIGPEVVYTHHFGDGNQDHRGVFEATLVAVRSIAVGAPRRVLSYEVPSSTEQVTGIAPRAFVPNYFVDIRKTLSKKLQAMKAYQDELRSFPHPRSLKGIETLAAYRGMSCHLAAAEAFQQIRDVWYT